MCGIVSIFTYNSSSGVDRDELRRMRDYMTPRGPDGCGEWYSADNRVGLGHRRLAIIDLSETGAQPMQNKEESLVITFNGEIYNYQSLRLQLEAKGYRFRSTSDTEVLLHLYAEKGPEMLNELRGMFAFAIWDNRRKGLFLARDPFGIKPLYYSDNRKTFRAASQVKALLKGDDIDTDAEPAGHVGFFLWGHVPEPYTLYKGIRSLPAGSYMEVDCQGKKKIKRYYRVKDIYSADENSSVSMTREDMHDLLRNALLDTVKHHLVADVPVGIFLSSGIDSATLLGLARETTASRFHTVTLGFREFLDTHNDETSLASLVAEQYDTQHHTIWGSKDDFLNDSTTFLESMDQPTIDGANSYFISKAAVKAGLKVALSGLGGDELFAGYPSFKQVPQIVSIFHPFHRLPTLGRISRIVSAPFLKHFTSPKYAGLLEYGVSYEGAYLLRRGMYMPWELPTILDGHLVREGWHELQPLVCLKETIGTLRKTHHVISALELEWYMRNQLLRDTDWASMAHSLEVRVPYVDTDLLRSISVLLNSAHPPGKLELASTPARPFPREITSRRKTGFSVPIQQWLVDHKQYSGMRGLRGWAHKVYESETGSRLPKQLHQRAAEIIPDYGP